MNRLEELLTDESIRRSLEEFGWCVCRGKGFGLRRESLLRALDLLLLFLDDDLPL